MEIGDKLHIIGNNCELLTSHLSYFCFYFSPNVPTPLKLCFKLNKLQVILAKIATYNMAVFYYHEAYKEAESKRLLNYTSIKKK